LSTSYISSKRLFAFLYSPLCCRTNHCCCIMTVLKVEHAVYGFFSIHCLPAVSGKNQAGTPKQKSQTAVSLACWTLLPFGFC
jgi:hypothetical protein